jgi:hypothetical protein
MTVPCMGGIEGAAEQPDPPRRELAGRQPRERQGRTWPLPRTTYL